MMTDDATTGSELVATLNRWHDSGAVWRVVERTPSRVTVALLRCDGGEEVQRLSSANPVWLTFLDGRTSSEE
jgi:hypothetical protein